MRRTSFSLLLVLIIVQSQRTAEAGGFAFSDNFNVVAPEQALADEVLAEAERLRSELAKQWLGKELPIGEQRAMITVQLTQGTRAGRFWAIGESHRELHIIRLTTSREQVFVVLRHELTHLVLEARFGGTLPAWADEGIAVFSASELANPVRQQTVNAWAQTGAWPDVKGVLTKELVFPDDYGFYVAAGSLTEYLLSLKSPSTFFDFALAGQHDGWDHAARTYYGRTTNELAAGWHAWVSRGKSSINLARLASHSLTAPGAFGAHTTISAESCR